MLAWNAATSCLGTHQVPGSLRDHYVIRADITLASTTTIHIYWRWSLPTLHPKYSIPFSQRTDHQREKYINLAGRVFWSLRLYSARIYSIGTNSSLACLHMPHLSKEFDDIVVCLVSTENYGSLREVGVSRTFWLFFLTESEDEVEDCLRVQRFSDSFYCMMFFVF